MPCRTAAALGCRGLMTVTWRLLAGDVDHVAGSARDGFASSAIVANSPGVDAGVVGVLKPDADAAAVLQQAIVHRHIAALRNAEDSASATVRVGCAQRALAVAVGAAETRVAAAVVAVIGVHRAA